MWRRKENNTNEEKEEQEAQVSKILSSVFKRATIIVKSVGKVTFFTSPFSSSPHPWLNVDQNVNVCARNCSVISQH